MLIKLDCFCVSGSKRNGSNSRSFVFKLIGESTKSLKKSRALSIVVFPDALGRKIRVNFKRRKPLMLMM